MKVISILISIFLGLNLFFLIIRPLVYGYHYSIFSVIELFFTIVLQTLLMIFFIRFALKGASDTVKSKKEIKHTDSASSDSDQGAGGIKWLCFFFPVVGLILYLVWQTEKPLSAKECGKFALIGVLVSFAIGLLGFLISMIALSSMY